MTTTSDAPAEVGYFERYVGDNERTKERLGPDKCGFPETAPEGALLNVVGDQVDSYRTAIAATPSGHLRRASHVFHDGAWQPIDNSEVGLFLRVKMQDRDWDGNLTRLEALEVATYRRVERAIESSRGGRVLDSRYVREIVDNVMEALALPQHFDNNGTGTLVADADVDPQLERARNAVKALLTYAPEGGYPDELGEVGAKYDGVGFAKDAEEYQATIDGRVEGKRRGTPLPFLGSDMVYYACLGSKDSGRSFKGRVEDLLEAVGLDRSEVER